MLIPTTFLALIFITHFCSGDITKTIITKLSPKRSNRKKGGNGLGRRKGNDPIEMDWVGAREMIPLNWIGREMSFREMKCTPAMNRNITTNTIA